MHINGYLSERKKILVKALVALSCWLVDLISTRWQEGFVEQVQSISSSVRYRILQYAALHFVIYERYFYFLDKYKIQRGLNFL